MIECPKCGRYTDEVWSPDPDQKEECMCMDCLSNLPDAEDYDNQTAQEIHCKPLTRAGADD